MYIWCTPRKRQAEAAFLRARDAQGAIDMHLRLGDHAAALRLAEAHAPAALPAVLAAEAAALLPRGREGAREEARLLQAEALYLKAGQPEQALQVHMEAKAWAGAFRVAQRHCPWRLGDVLAACEKGCFRGDGEHAGGGYHHHDDALTRAYGRRVDGAQHDRFLGQLLRALEIVGAELGDWPAAWAMMRFEEQQKGRDKDGDGGGNGNGAKRARDRLLCVQLRHLLAGAAADAEEGGPFPLLQQALALLREKGAPCPVSEPMAVGIYEQLVTPLLGLALEEEATTEAVAMVGAWRGLLHAVMEAQVDRRMLVLLLQHPGKGTAAAAAAGEPEADERAADEFRELFLALHSTDVLLACRPHQSLGKVACHAALAALRYAGTLLPADKAFYRAGDALRRRAEALDDTDKEEAEACRHLAFLCLNRYVDLVEAIADQDPSLVDPRPLAACAALPPPSLSSLPKRQHVTDEATRDEARAWVLAACGDMVGRPLPSAQHQRGQDGGGFGLLAEPLFATPPAHARCAVTGCPLLQQDGETTVVGGGSQPGGAGAGPWQPIARANTWAWQAYVSVFGECPWTGKEAGKVGPGRTG